MRLSLTLLLVVLPAYSEAVSIGVKAGVPLTDAYSDVQVTDNGSGHFEDRYTVGPTLEVHVPFHLSFEVDALYRHSGFNVVGGSVANGSATVNEWQIPLLVKYEIPLGPVRPFIDGGLAYRHVAVNVANTLAQSYLSLQNPDDAGFSFGGGIGLKFRRFRISPEIRYTHWGQTAFSNSAVLSKNNQADLLVGFTF